MKFNILCKDIQNVDAVSYLKKLGIKNTNKYLNFNNIEVDANYSRKLENALCLLKRYKENNREIKIIGDS